MPSPTALAAILLCAAQQQPSEPAAQAAEAPPLPAPELLDHAALTARMRAIAGEHPDLATAIAVGHSRQGREILALRIASGEMTPGRPAILVVANLEGPQVFSSAIALWEIERLLERAKTDEAVRGLLEGTTLYFVPRAHPDAAEARFRAPRSEVEATGQGADEDRDGQVGEDPPSDVDGDGEITWMRVPDPDGEWVADPKDARATIQAEKKKGERGRWKLVREGRDLDKDEQASEDAPADAVVNENFPSGWKEHDARAGLFPLDEPEARALADFVIAHHDIGLALAYGSLDNLVNAPKSVAGGGGGEGRRGPRGVPEAGWIEEDAGLLAELGRRRSETNGRKAKGKAAGPGSFTTWAYDHRGLVSLAAALWDIPAEKVEKKAAEGDAKPKEGEEKPKTEAEPPKEGAEAPKEAAQEPQAGQRAGRGRRGGGGGGAEGESSEEANRLAWLDAQGDSGRFKPWTSFEHPELGTVEIGGWRPYARIEPPAADASKIAQGELDFLVSLGGVLPRLQIVEAKAKALADGLIEVTAALENNALLPLRSAAAERADTVRPARVTLVLPEGATLVAGSRDTLVGSLKGAGGRRELRWLVAGERLGSVGLALDTEGAGTAQLTVEVER
jgi:Zinc carboxypeptidase